MKARKPTIGVLGAKTSFCRIALFCVLAVTASSSQTLTTVISFDNSNGAYPIAALVQGVDGNLYGTTENGGANGFGTVFVTTTAGALTTLHNFANTDGAQPTELVLAANETFDGIAGSGGADNGGAAFMITPKGRFTLLNSFDSPDGFDNTLLQSTDGDFYGTTFGGGSSGYGSVFKMTATGTLSTLYNFCTQFECTDQGGPTALVQGTDGNFYGTNTSGNSSSDFGTVFRITPGGTLSTLYTFCARASCTDGIWPDGLLQAGNGDFYGTTIYGGVQSDLCQPVGPGGCGTIYNITRSGTLATLYTFCMQVAQCMDGFKPVGPLIQGTDGNFYGTTSPGTTCASTGRCGTIFRMTPSGQLTTLHVFSLTDGSQPGPLMQATDGNLYGTTTLGGTSGFGTVFRLATGLRPFVKLVRLSGKVGQTTGIIGQGLSGTTSVSFNGSPASFTVVSDTLINATVPAGATTGFVSIQRPGGTLKSNVVFRVDP